MTSTYHEIRFTTYEGNKTWWASDLKKEGDSYIGLRVKKDGDSWFGNKQFMCVVHAEDVIYIKPAIMNRTYCELETN